MEKTLPSSHWWHDLEVLLALVCAWFACFLWLSLGRLHRPLTLVPGCWNREADLILFLFPRFPSPLLFHVSHPNSLNFLPVAHFPGSLLLHCEFSPEAKGNMVCWKVLSQNWAAAESDAPVVLDVWPHVAEREAGSRAELLPTGGFFQRRRLFLLLL